MSKLTYVTTLEHTMSAGKGQGDNDPGVRASVRHHEGVATGCGWPARLADALRCGSDRAMLSSLTATRLDRSGLDAPIPQRNPLSRQRSVRSDTRKPQGFPPAALTGGPTHALAPYGAHDWRI